VLSIKSQIKEMLQIAEREGLEIVVMKRESHSAKETEQRPVFNEIIVDFKTYAKHTLKEGSDQEKRELMGCLISKIKNN